MTTDKKCLRCGGTQLQPGRIQSTGRVWFKPANTKFFTLNTSDVEVRADICLDCGTIELVGDTHKAQSLTGTVKPV
jgi:predicted nucleic-acid-binding Zn-ribbon protein